MFVSSYECQKLTNDVLRKRKESTICCQEPHNGAQKNQHMSQGLNGQGSAFRERRPPLSLDCEPSTKFQILTNHLKQ